MSDKVLDLLEELSVYVPANRFDLLDRVEKVIDSKTPQKRMFSPEEVLRICEAYIATLEGELKCLGECIDRLGEKAEKQNLSRLIDSIRTLVILKNNLSMPDDVLLKTKQALRSATLSEPTEAKDANPS